MDTIVIDDINCVLEPEEDGWVLITSHKLRTPLMTESVVIANDKLRMSLDDIMDSMQSEHEETPEKD